MYQGYRAGAILLIGGSGVRFGGGVPKQFRLLGGKPLYRHGLDTLLDMEVFDEIVLVCHPEWADRLRGLPARVAIGKETRQGSSLEGLLGFEFPPEIVLIHDGVRPFLTEGIVRANLDAAIRFGAADTCIRSADTLVHAPSGQWIGSIPKREEYFRGQTPQTFRYGLILEAHEKALERGIVNASDDCRLVLELGARVVVVEGSESNLKITSEFDLQVAEALLFVGKEKEDKAEGDDARADKKWRIDIPSG